MKMKNKKAEQIAAKRKHREQLKAKRRSEPAFQRPAPKLKTKPTILIVCEGKNTEPSYFNQFRLSTATVKPIGEGYNTVSLVERAKQLTDEDTYEQVWCVFDADPKPDNPDQESNFNNAISKAVSKGFGVAYSNQAFEYWIILHFEDHQGGGMRRTEYNARINQLLKPFGVVYDGAKSKRVTEELFELLDGVEEKTGLKRVDMAIRRAGRNYDRFDHFNPAIKECSTTVFRLVKVLLEYL